MSQKHSDGESRVVVIGGGPAGLTAAYELTRLNLRPIVLEQADKVGGIARTENYRGYHFDMGGHRFFTKADAVNKMWRELLGDDFLLRPRLSRIFYRNKFFYYPLRYFNALAGLGVLQAILIVGSFVRWQIFPYKQEETFEQWVTNRFGKRLFETFFKTYTEKVWGIPCSELKAEWAAQRIKDLSLKTAVLNMLVKPNGAIKTLIEEFHYPRLGPGMLWNRVKDEIEDRSGQVRLNARVERIHLAGNRIDHVVVADENGEEETVAGDQFISSMPVSDFIKRLDSVPEAVLEAANRLSYRDFLTVGLIVDQPELFPDNWIYVHEPEVKVGRIQNYKNWSPDMVADPSKTSLGLEYFCTEGDDIWNMSDQQLIELGKREVQRIGLAEAADVVDGVVYRVPKAYPIYDSDYGEYLEIIRQFVAGIENFETIGRNGLHRYNNQDHSMVTAMLAVRNLIFAEENDVWDVNTSPEYHEEFAGDADEIELIVDEGFARVFSRADPVAFGVSAGVISAVSMLAATLMVLIRGGEATAVHLALLAGVFPGVTVSLIGAILASLYLLLVGFLFGGAFAYLRNLAVLVSARIVHRDIEMRLLRRLFDLN